MKSLKLLAGQARVRIEVASAAHEVPDKYAWFSVHRSGYRPMRVPSSADEMPDYLRANRKERCVDESVAVSEIK